MHVSVNHAPTKPNDTKCDFGRNIATSASAHNVSSSFIIDISSRSMLAVFIISYCKKIRMIHRSYINDTATIVVLRMEHSTRYVFGHRT